MDRVLEDLLKGNEELLRKQYESKVVALIRERYSQDEENAILRKKLANLDNGEFEIYNAYVEDCKLRAKTI